MRLLRNLFKKKGFVGYEREISCFSDEKKEIYFKGKDFYDFLVEYKVEYEKRGLTKDNNDAAMLLQFLIDNFKLFDENEKIIK